jgi:hypothetical protein
MVTFTKIEVCTDYLPLHPVKAISAIWAETDSDDLLETLGQFFRMAICAQESAYLDGKDREQLTLFYSFLYDLITAMHWAKRTKSIPETTLELIKTLMAKFDIQYLRKELFDLIDAAISYDGKLLERPRPMDMLLYYRWFGCFIEAAYKIVA